MLPKLAVKRAFRVVAALGEFAVAGRPRQMIVLTKILHELPRLVAGHWSSSLAASRNERVTRLQPDVDRQRLVIDPKYDACTKSRILGFSLGIAAGPRNFLDAAPAGQINSVIFHGYWLFMPAWSEEPPE
jgi:hypothetical protein